MEDISLPMRPFPENKTKMFLIAEMMYIEILEQELENEFGSTNNDSNDIKNLPQDFQFDNSETDTRDAFISDIKSTHYEVMRPKEVLQSCSHLNEKQKEEDLRRLIKNILNFLMEFFVLTQLLFLLMLIP